MWWIKRRKLRKGLLWVWKQFIFSLFASILSSSWCVVFTLNHIEIFWFWEICKNIIKFMENIHLRKLANVNFLDQISSHAIHTNVSFSHWTSHIVSMKTPPPLNRVVSNFDFELNKHGSRFKLSCSQHSFLFNLSYAYGIMKSSLKASKNHKRNFFTKEIPLCVWLWIKIYFQ